MSLAEGRTYKQTWVTQFGSFDALHREVLFDGFDSIHGIPDVLRVPIPSPLPTAFIDWPHRRSFPDGTGLHFFVDDYQFERVWTHPHWYVGEFKTRHPLLFGVDFSIFSDTPICMQVWQTYRTRWLCRWYQEQGVTMIPTVSWGNKDSFDFVFRGIPKGSVIALSSIGRKGANEGSNGGWDEGYIAAIEAIDPELVFIVGSHIGEDLEKLAEVRYYKAHRKQRLDAVRELDKVRKSLKKPSAMRNVPFGWLNKVK
jgi:hypothetical protein